MDERIQPSSPMLTEERLIDQVPRCRELRGARGPRSGAALFVLLPVACFLGGLEVWGTGWSFGPSWTARGLAWAWALGGALASASICAALHQEARQRPPLWLGAGLVVWVGFTSSLWWCAIPAPISARVEALSRMRRPDQRTFRTLALELLQPGGERASPLPDPAMALALAAHRHLILNEPSSGLALAALVEHGALRFWSAQEVWAHLEPVLREHQGIEDAAERLRRVEESFWGRLGGAGGALAGGTAGQVSGSSLKELHRQLATAGSGQAKRILVQLARCGETSAWNDPTYHAVASHALALLGQGADAALEHELDWRTRGGSPPQQSSLSTESLLLGLAKRSFDGSRRARARLQEELAADLGCEAWLTDVRSLPADDEVSRLNVDTRLQERMRALETRPSTTWLAQVLAGTEEDQLIAWNSSRRAVSLARALNLSSRRNEALRVIARVEEVCPDRYRRWTAATLARGWAGEAR